MYEIWKEINGTNGKYSVSSLGRVRRNECKFYRKNRYGYISEYTLPPKILPQYEHGGNGDIRYYQVNIIVNGKNKLTYVHRLVAEAFCKNNRNVNDVDHINRDKHDNRACNLRWVNRSENMLNKDFSNYKGNSGRHKIKI